MRITFLISCFIYLQNVNAQTGYFKTAEDLEQHNIVEFEDVSWRSSAFGCNVNFFKNGEKEKGYDQHDIFAFVDDGKYYRFYKYAIIHMLVRGEISFFGLVPTTLTYNEKDKSFTIKGTDKMLLFVTAGASGELKTLKRKHLLELVQQDAEIMNLYENKEIDHLNCILLYNLKHPTPNAFIMDQHSQMSLQSFAEEIDSN